MSASLSGSVADTVNVLDRPTVPAAVVSSTPLPSRSVFGVADTIVGGALPADTSTSEWAVTFAPDGPVAIAAITRCPARRNVAVADRPVASSNAPSVSRSQVTVAPGDALATTVNAVPVVAVVAAGNVMVGTSATGPVMEFARASRSTAVRRRVVARAA